ncbi:conjugal transfer protein TraN [Sphingomonas immobilis]|uniref:Conjugal transfer protein TraN n=1 Tax=Sphingomonas immobilis TaxID=3063997 RepID=A0ABT8ZVY4_9SPHN|nr:conjugal transfer protein TraN [Sphingomonas sp. CA1-15]MDO7841738.1 conjugal transfer protein TraN [Sphingomonas sp. CA1-15]
MRAPSLALLAGLGLLGLAVSAHAATAMPQRTLPTEIREPVEPTDPTGPSDPGSPSNKGGPSNPVTGQLCAADLNGNGDAADPGEIASCDRTQGGAPQCPIGRVACIADETGTYGCPIGPQYACMTPIGGGNPQCSSNACADPAITPFQETPPINDPGAPADGAVDAEGNCTANIEIFGGRGMRCRPPGIANTLSNCCKNKDRIIKDGMGSKFSSLSLKIQVIKGVFRGVSAAFQAFRAGATAGEAASAGFNAIIGVDPTSIAINLAINFLIEVLLQGCDQEDMETGMLRSSGMCHEVGAYCTVSFLGLCLQPARGNCCFNTKLGRIIQEQGRPQLKSFNGIGWGTPEHPVCRGFTPEEFQALDFSKIDLSEYYAEIEARAQTTIQLEMKDRVDAYLQIMH